jgi:hypothetical protein
MVTRSAQFTIQTTSTNRTAILNYVQNITHLIQLNPLVISCELLPPPSFQTYSIVDRLMLFGFYPLTTTYTAEFKNDDKGITIKGIAAFGVTTSSQWIVELDGRVHEIAEVTAPWFLIGVVENQWTNSHANLGIALKERLDLL